MAMSTSTKIKRLTFLLYKKYAAASRLQRATMLAVALITRLWEWVWLLSSSAFVPIVLASSACLCLILKSK